MKKLFVFTSLIIASFQLEAQSPTENLKKLGIELPPVSAPIANYVKYVQTGNLIYLSGHGPLQSNGNYILGKLGKNVSNEQGYEAARITGIQLLATLQSAIGDLSRVKRIVKILGLVNCTDDFTEQPKIINGCSDLMVAVFGEKGKHARSAIGTNALPMGMAVEVEMIVEINP
jgi:enamine deaminase RidA (YjgF/YER057c/UK114 family)